MKKSFRKTKMTTALALLGCGGYWLLCSSPATGKFISHFGSKKLFTELEVGTARWNPFTGRLTLSQITIKAPPDSKNQAPLQIGKVVIHSKPFTLKNKDRVLEKVDIHSVQLENQQSIKDLIDWLSALRAHIQANRIKPKRPLLIHQLRIFDIRLDDDKATLIDHGTLVMHEFSSRPWLNEKPLSMTFVGDWKDKGPVILAGNLDLRPGFEDEAKDLDMTLPTQSFPEAQRAFIKEALSNRGSDVVETFHIAESDSEIHVKEGERSGSLVNRLKDKVLPFRIRSQFIKKDKIRALLFNIYAPMRDGDEKKVLQVIRRAQQYFEGQANENELGTNIFERLRNTVTGVTQKTQRAIDTTRKVIEKTQRSIDKTKEMLDSTREAARRLFSSKKDKENAKKDD
ncbi:MAG: hypothetical protein P1V97_18395 [Planctomycetota bacterium]|nr:hypothetical protein [Planctomycetota bacterium]